MGSSKPYFTLIYHYVNKQFRTKHRTGTVFGGSSKLAYQLGTVHTDTGCTFN
jgi:hypothetical protein